MLSYWGGFFEEWEANEKVEFDGPNRLIIVHDNVTALDIRKDVWSAAVRWLGTLNRGNDRFYEPMDRTGLDPVPGGNTGDSYFLINNWKLVVDFSKVRISGVLFSRDFDTAYYTYDLQPQYAAQVSSIVNTVDVPFMPTDVDVDAPVWTTVEGITNAYQNGSTINLSWGKARDANPVSYKIYTSKFSFNLYDDGNLYDISDGYFYTMRGFDNEAFVDGTTYYIGVRAVDIYGNETTNSNFADVTYDTPTVLSEEEKVSIAGVVWANDTRTLTSAGAGGATAQEVWEYHTRELTAGGSGGFNEAELHTALDNYTNKDDWKATLTGIPAAVWGYVTRSLTVATGLTAEQEAKLDNIESNTDRLLDYNEGDWKIIANQMIYYDRNGVEFLRFDLLDSAGQPISRGAMQRIGV